MFSNRPGASMYVPRFISVDRRGGLDDGVRFVLSFVEVLDTSTVVRLHVLDAEAVRWLAGPVLGLRDDRGQEFVWLNSAFGGMIAGEVLHQFAGIPAKEARSLSLFHLSDGVLLDVVGLL
jgi:hypothetical protein